MVITRSEKEMKDILESENKELDAQLKTLEERKKQKKKELKIVLKTELKKIEKEIKRVRQQLLTNTGYLEVINKKLAREEHGKKEQEKQEGNEADEEKGKV